MPRFDVYRLPPEEGDGYLLDVQADILDQLDTRVVVPLLPPARAPKLIRELNPILRFGDTELVLVPQRIATLEMGELGRRIGTLAGAQDDIIRALDLLLTGF